MSTIWRALRKAKAGRLGPQVEGHEVGPAAHLPGGDRVLRVVGAAGVEDATHGPVRRDPVGQGGGGARLALDPHLQRLQPLEQHPGVEGRERGAGVADYVAIGLHQEVVAPSTAPPSTRPWPSMCLVAE